MQSWMRAPTIGGWRDHRDGPGTSDQPELKVAEEAQKLISDPPLLLGRIREYDASGYGMSLSSLLISPWRRPRISPTQWSSLEPPTARG